MPKPTAPRRCKDCPPDGFTRKVATPGPRCAEHMRAFKKKRSEAAHGRQIGKAYSLTPAEYQALYAAQGGRCAIAGCRATGAARRLSVDHDHECCDSPVSCGRCIRGLLCLNHNRILTRTFQQALDAYLASPPAHQLWRRTA